MNDKCCICGKEIPEKRLLQGKKTCSTACARIVSKNDPIAKQRRSEAQKRRFQDPKKYEEFLKKIRKPEVRQKLSEAGKRRYANPEEHMKQSERTKQMHKDPEYRAKFEASMHSKETSQKISEAQKRRFQDPEKYEAFLATMNKPSTLQKCKESQLDATVKQKIHETKKRNGSYGKSKWGDEDYIKLIKVFSENNIIRQHYTKEYPFNCDFYIKSLDLYIECHYSQFHNYKPFDSTNEQHLVELREFQELFEKTPKNDKGENQYSKIIYTWTDLDVRKYQCVQENHLNFLRFYFRKDFDTWLNSMT